MSFNRRGRYLQLDGTTYFAVGTTHQLNRYVTNVDLARATVTAGCIFSADFRCLAPANGGFGEGFQTPALSARG